VVWSDIDNGQPDEFVTLRDVGYLAHKVCHGIGAPYTDVKPLPGCILVGPVLFGMPLIHYDYERRAMSASQDEHHRRTSGCYPALPTLPRVICQSVQKIRLLIAQGINGIHAPRPQRGQQRGRNCDRR
jgi:hypothetical protein